MAIHGRIIKADGELMDIKIGDLGKMGEGGGTVAKFLALYGMEIIDYGTPVLSMHSPFKIGHKGDIYMTYKDFKAFLKAPV